MSNFLELDRRLKEQQPKQVQQPEQIQSFHGKEIMTVKKKNKYTISLWSHKGSYTHGTYMCSVCSKNFDSDLVLYKPSYKPHCYRCIHEIYPDRCKSLLILNGHVYSADDKIYDCSKCGIKFVSELNFYNKGLTPVCVKCRSGKKKSKQKSIFYKQTPSTKKVEKQTSSEWTTVKKKKRKKKKPTTPIDPSKVSQYPSSDNFSRELYPYGPYTCVFCEQSFNSKANLRGITNPNCDKCYQAKILKS